MTTKDRSHTYTLINLIAGIQLFCGSYLPVVLNIEPSPCLMLPLGNRMIVIIYNYGGFGEAGQDVNQDVKFILILVLTLTMYLYKCIYITHFPVTILGTYEHLHITVRAFQVFLSACMFSNPLFKNAYVWAQS